MKKLFLSIFLIGIGVLTAPACFSIDTTFAIPNSSIEYTMHTGADWENITVNKRIKKPCNCVKFKFDEDKMHVIKAALHDIYEITTINDIVDTMVRVNNENKVKKLMHIITNKNSRDLISENQEFMKILGIRPEAYSWVSYHYVALEDDGIGIKLKKIKFE